MHHPHTSSSTLALSSDLPVRQGAMPSVTKDFGGTFTGSFTDAELDFMRDAFCSATGDQLLRFMRSLHYGLPEESAKIAAVPVATKLGWLVQTPTGALKLTPKGQRITDAAREYCNWLD